MKLMLVTFTVLVAQACLSAYALFLVVQERREQEMRDVALDVVCKTLVEAQVVKTCGILQQHKQQGNEIDNSSTGTGRPAQY